MKKYKIREDLSREVFGLTVYRIEALRDFADVKKGDLGGFIESERNLSHFGQCWVYDNACIYERGQVKKNAIVAGEAKVYGLALVSDSAKILDKAFICGSAKIYGKAIIKDEAIVDDSASVYDDAIVSGDARLLDFAKAFESAKITGEASIVEFGQVFGFARIGGCVSISGGAKVFGNVDISGEVDIGVCAQVFGDVKINNELEFGGNAIISSTMDYVVFKQSGRVITFFKDSHEGISFSCGCQNGKSLEWFKQRIFEDGGFTLDTLPKHRQEYLEFIEQAKVILKEVD